MTDPTIHTKVATQFGPNAAAYAVSAGHANPSVLASLVALTQPAATDSVLDVATGAGHVALAFAPQVASVVALDLTPEMLRQVLNAAEARSLINVIAVEGRAEDLPFVGKAFDIVAVRLAPHHFADVCEFLRSAHRVLQNSGKLLLVDSVVPEDDALDREINRLELLRDPSHVRDYRVSEWKLLLEGAGFEISSVRVGMHAGGTRMEVNGWMDRIGTPEENRDLVRQAFQVPTPELIDALEIERKEGAITFSLPEVTILASAIT